MQLWIRKAHPTLHSMGDFKLRKSKTVGTLDAPSLYQTHNILLKRRFCWWWWIVFLSHPHLPGPTSAAETSCPLIALWFLWTGDFISFAAAMTPPAHRERPMSRAKRGPFQKSLKSDLQWTHWVSNDTDFMAALEDNDDDVFGGWWAV